MEESSPPKSQRRQSDEAGESKLSPAEKISIFAELKASILSELQRDFCGKYDDHRADRIDEGHFAVMPPIETFLGVPADIRRNRFFELVTVGDVVVGQINSDSTGAYTVRLLGFEQPKSYEIWDLDIECLLPSLDVAEVGEGPMWGFAVGDLVRCEVTAVEGTDVRLGVKGTHDPPHALTRQSLGKITEDSLPQSYRNSRCAATRGYDELQRTFGALRNPGAIGLLGAKFGLTSVTRSSLFPSLRKSVPYRLGKDELRKKQAELYREQTAEIARHLLRIGRLEDALYAFNKAFDEYASETDAYVARGTMFACANYYKEAVKDFSKALLIDPSHAAALEKYTDTLVHVADTYLRGKESARTLYVACLRVAPNHAGAKAGLARADEVSRDIKSEPVLEVASGSAEHEDDGQASIPSRTNAVSPSSDSGINSDASAVNPAEKNLNAGRNAAAPNQPSDPNHPSTPSLKSPVETAKKGGPRTAPERRTKSHDTETRQILLMGPTGEKPKNAVEGTLTSPICPERPEFRRNREVHFGGEKNKAGKLAVIATSPCTSTVELARNRSRRLGKSNFGITTTSPNPAAYSTKAETIFNEPVVESKKFREIGESFPPKIREKHDRRQETSARRDSSPLGKIQMNRQNRTLGGGDGVAGSCTMGTAERTLEPRPSIEILDIVDSGGGESASTVEERTFAAPTNDGSVEPNEPIPTSAASGEASGVQDDLVEEEEDDLDWFVVDSDEKQDNEGDEAVNDGSLLQLPGAAVEPGSGEISRIGEEPVCARRDETGESAKVADGDVGEHGEPVNGLRWSVVDTVGEYGAEDAGSDAVEETSRKQSAREERDAVTSKQRGLALTASNCETEPHPTPIGSAECGKPPSSRADLSRTSVENKFENQQAASPPKSDKVLSDARASGCGMSAEVKQECASLLVGRPSNSNDEMVSKLRVAENARAQTEHDKVTDIPEAVGEQREPDSAPGEKRKQVTIDRKSVPQHNSKKQKTESEHLDETSEAGREKRKLSSVVEESETTPDAAKKQKTNTDGSVVPLEQNELLNQLLPELFKAVSKVVEEFSAGSRPGVREGSSEKKGTAPGSLVPKQEARTSKSNEKEAEQASARNTRTPELPKLGSSSSSFSGPGKSESCDSRQQNTVAMKREYSESSIIRPRHGILPGPVGVNRVLPSGNSHFDGVRKPASPALSNRHGSGETSDRDQYASSSKDLSFKERTSSTWESITDSHPRVKSEFLLTSPRKSRGNDIVLPGNRACANNAGKIVGRTNTNLRDGCSEVRTGLLEKPKPATFHEYHRQRDGSRGSEVESRSTRGRVDAASRVEGEPSAAVTIFQRALAYKSHGLYRSGVGGRSRPRGGRGTGGRPWNSDRTSHPQPHPRPSGSRTDANFEDAEEDSGPVTSAGSCPHQNFPSSESERNQRRSYGQERNFTPSSEVVVFPSSSRPPRGTAGRPRRPRGGPPGVSGQGHRYSDVGEWSGPVRGHVRGAPNVHGGRGGGRSAHTRGGTRGLLGTRLTNDSHHWHAPK